MASSSSAAAAAAVAALPPSSSPSPIHRTHSCRIVFLPPVRWLAPTVLANRAAMVMLVSSPETACRKPMLVGHSPPLRANRKAVDRASPEESDELDEDLRTGLNEVSTEAVKVMLSGTKKLVDPFKEKVEHVTKYLMQEGHLEAANFMVVIRGMLDHKVIPEKDNLKGVYKKAFEKIWALMEDSGWLLSLSDDTLAVGLVDEEFIPPVLETQY